MARQEDKRGKREKERRSEGARKERGARYRGQGVNVFVVCASGKKCERETSVRVVHSQSGV